MGNEVLKQISGLLEKHDKFLITATADADGDSVGAEIALKSILETKMNGTKGRIVEIINDAKCPKRFEFLEGIEEIKIPAENNHGVYDVVFFLDGGIERTGSVYSMAEKCKVKVIIDHHKFGSSEKYDFSFVDPSCSSTAEMVYRLLENEHWKVKLTPKIAAALYLGIIFDTGFLTYSLTTPQTYKIASKLIGTGIDFPDIAKKGIRDRSFSGLMLLGKILNEIKHESMGKIIYSIVSQEMMKQCGATKEDFEGIIENMFNVYGVEVAVLFKEYKKDSYKISFRSRGNIDVGRFSRKIVGDEGGGHARAAGCTLRGGIEGITERVINGLKSNFITV